MLPAIRHCSAMKEENTPSWALVCADEGSGEWNMAVDEALLDSAASGAEPLPAVRFYQWNPPAVSIGRNQTLPSSVAASAAEAGLEIVRRPSGGGAVIHSQDLTYSVVVPESSGVIGTYRFIAEALIHGLSRVGIDAQVVEHGAHGASVSCFALPTGADLEAGGLKICGSAQTRRAGWVLQHGCIPIVDILALARRVFGSGVSDERWTCIGNLNSEVTVDELKRYFTVGFDLLFGGPPERRGLSDDEMRRVETLMSKGRLADPLVVL